MRKSIFLAMVVAVSTLGAGLAQAYTIKGADCKELYATWKGKSASKAFALTADGRQCGASWGYDSIKNAKKRALRECRGLDQTLKCKIYKTK